MLIVLKFQTSAFVKITVNRVKIILKLIILFIGFYYKYIVLWLDLTIIL